MVSPTRPLGQALTQAQAENEQLQHVYRPQTDLSWEANQVPQDTRVGTKASAQDPASLQDPASQLVALQNTLQTMISEFSTTVTDKLQQQHVKLQQLLHQVNNISASEPCGVRCFCAGPRCLACRLHSTLVYWGGFVLPTVPVFITLPIDTSHRSKVEAGLQAGLSQPRPK